MLDSGSFTSYPPQLPSNEGITFNRAFAGGHLVYFFSAIILAAACLLGFLPDSISYTAMAWISLLQIALMLTFTNIPRPSFASSFFLIVFFIFHCGHILCIGFDLPSEINLDFRNYASDSVIQASFRFYLLSVYILTLGLLFGQFIFARPSSSVRHESTASPSLRPKSMGLALAIIGLIPRLYFDLIRIQGALDSGYYGVYTSYVPSYIQALAFVFDAGVLLILASRNLTSAQRKVLFWIILVEKIAVLSTGARQEAVCFVVVWIYLFLNSGERPSAGRIASSALFGIVLLVIISAVGDARAETGGIFSSSFADVFFGTSLLNMMGDSLGEFGSAFTTLVSAVGNIPCTIPYGYGLSFIAALMSFGPGIVARFPALVDASCFVSALHSTAYFGGSVIGEAYYNFGGLGFLLMLPLGLLVGYVQVRLAEWSAFPALSDRSIVRAWVSAVLFICLLLYVRGYVSDMAMKLYFTLFAYLIVNFIFRSTAKVRNSRDV